MESNKVFYINAMVNLPDDFNGDTTDAIQFLLDYRKDKEHEAISQEVDENGKQMTMDELYDDLWSHEGRVTMQSSLLEYDYEEDK